MLTKLLIPKRFIICLFFTAIISCEKDPKVVGPVGPPGPNSKAPVAKANNDTTLFYPEQNFLLDASKSYDPGGRPISYSWRQLSSPWIFTPQQLPFQQSVASIRLYELGNYVFELTVKNNIYHTAKDTVTILYDAVSTQKKVSIKEYGTLLPVEGVEVAICLDPTKSQCRVQRQQYFTDGTGVFNFDAKAYSIEWKNLESKGYWKSVPGYGAFYFDGNGLNINSIYTLADNFEALVVPVVEIPVRITDKRTLPVTQQYFANGIMIDGYNYNNYNNKSELITLRPGIDTAFKIRAFGNMKNGFTVAGLWYDDWGGIYPESIVFESEKQITRNTLDTVYIKYQ